VRTVPIPTIVLAAAATLSPASAGAQPAAPRLQLDLAQPASAHGPFFVVEGPVGPSAEGRGRVAASLLTSYARSPLTVHARRAGQMWLLGTPVHDSIVAHASFAARVWREVALDLMLPVALYQRGDDVATSTTAVPAARTSGFGDVRIGALTRGWSAPWLGWVFGVRGWLPSGSQGAYMSDGRAHMAALVGGFARVDAARFGCTLDVAPTFVVGRAGDRLAFGCAADARIGARGPSLGAEVVAAAVTFDPALSPGSQVELWGTLRHSFGPFGLGLGGGPGMGTAPGTAALRVLALLSVATPQPPEHKAQAAGARTDEDLDGVVDAADACPHEAGPASPDPRRNGCPRLDRDGDGVDDSVDACPDKPGVTREDPQASGCPDTDNDRVVDKLDRCPLEPARDSADPATRGCPKRARLRGDRFVVEPRLHAEPARAADDADAIEEIAFTLRASASLARVAVEVTLQGAQDDAQLAERAAERAAEIVARLVELGVDRKRLDPVGAVSTAPSKVEVVVTERHGSGAPR
jgi:hypothetical protein